MTTFIAKYISKKILGERLENNFGKDDPYFETVPATRLDGRPDPKKTKKRKKALPPGISDHDAKVLTKVKRRAYRLDMSLFNCCGIRFGWSSVIGIIPVIGDAIDGFMAMMVLRTCQQIEGGLPKDVQAKMMFNIILDFAVGLVPFVGDLVDALFRANTRNAVVLEKFLREKGAKALKDHNQRPPSIDPTDPDVYDAQIEAERGPPPQYSSAAPTRSGTQSQQHKASAARPAKASDRGSWFGFGPSSREDDLERGDELRRHDEVPPVQPPRPNEPRQPASTLQKGRR
jgi:hypothetical protein